jgi:hypothetical protein
MIPFEGVAGAGVLFAFWLPCFDHCLAMVLVLVPVVILVAVPVPSLLEAVLGVNEQKTHVHVQVVPRDWKLTNHG